MQNYSGFGKFLTIGSISDFFHLIIGRRKNKAWLVEHVFKCKPGFNVVDIGCGTGVNVLEYLSKEINYFGYDISPDYIKQAKKKYGNYASFHVGDTKSIKTQQILEYNWADLVICKGVLHHLNDEDIVETLTFAKDLLKKNGRFVCLEPTYLLKQTSISKWFISQDRGENIKTEDQWKKIFSSVFESFSTNIITGMSKIPYVYIILQFNKTR